MGEDYCEIRFASETAKVRSMVFCLLDFIEGQAPSNHVREDLRLVFSELLYNAVIHGNKEDAGKYVHVKLKVTGNFLTAYISDEGRGFDYPEVVEYAETEPALYSGHGRGIILVRALTDNFSFNELGNVAKFEKRLK